MAYTVQYLGKGKARRATLVAYSNRTSADKRKIGRKGDRARRIVTLDGREYHVTKGYRGVRL